MTCGFDKPRYVLPFDHRGSFETKMFGWEGTLTAEQTAGKTQLDRLKGDNKAYDLELRPRLMVQAIDAERALESATGSWHGVRLNAPDWSHKSHSLAVTARIGGDRLLHLMINAYWEALEFEIPSGIGEQGQWRRCVDTALNSPDDICQWADAPAIRGATYAVQPRSTALLIASAGEP